MRLSQWKCFLCDQPAYQSRPELKTHLLVRHPKADPNILPYKLIGQTKAELKGSSSDPKGPRQKILHRYYSKRNQLYTKRQSFLCNLGSAKLRPDEDLDDFSVERHEELAAQATLWKEYFDLIMKLQMKTKAELLAVNHSISFSKSFRDGDEQMLGFVKHFYPDFRLPDTESVSEIDGLEERESKSPAVATDAMPDAMSEVNVYEIDNCFCYQMDVPGVEPSDLSVDILNKLLKVNAVRKQTIPIEAKLIHKSKFIHQMEHSFSLPDTIIEDSCDANLANGVLKFKKK